VRGGWVRAFSLAAYTGSVGFLSLGVGSYSNLFVETLCDGGTASESGTQCLSPTSGQSCAFTCAAGYMATGGTANRTCTLGVWSGTNLVCSLSA
jgi:hypothetical protein